MMDARAYELAIRKQQLLMSSTQLRHDMGVYSDGLRPVFTAGDGVVAAGQWLRAHPGVVAAFAVGFVVIQPMRAWRWARRAFSIWRGWRKVLVFIGI